jgi:sugar lactone lactonase YvrE
MRTVVLLAVLPWLAVLAQPADNAPPTASAAGIFAGSPERLASGFQFLEGPLWHPDGYLLFSDIPARRIYRLEGDGRTTVWRADSGSSNGLALDLEGRLLACEHGNRRVSVTRSSGAVEALAERWEGARFNSPNDAAVSATGSIYFTDPLYGLGTRPREISFQGVFRVDPDGRITCLAPDLRTPNGIAFAPEQKVLYVADTEANQVRAFAVAPEGALTDGRVLAAVPTPDGMKVDRDGRLFVTSGDGVVVLAPDGARLAVLSLPEIPANCAFGEADGKTLFITARSSLYRVRVLRPGIVPGAPAPRR